MAGSNSFVVFDPPLTNADSDAIYVAKSAVASGLSTGIADTTMHNKLFHQVSIMVAALGELISDMGGVASDGSVATLKAALEAAVVTIGGAQTLTGVKTMTSPIIHTPTGIVKGDVGLGNVDNTSDATKNAAAVTLTNKTLSSPAIMSPHFPVTGAAQADILRVGSNVNLSAAINSHFQIMRNYDSIVIFDVKGDGILNTPNVIPNAALISGIDGNKLIAGTVHDGHIVDVAAAKVGWGYYSGNINGDNALHGNKLVDNSVLDQKIISIGGAKVGGGINGANINNSSISNDKLATDVEGGQISFNVSGTNYNYTHVTFPRAFSGTPFVVTSINYETGANHWQVSTGAYNINTTGFDLEVANGGNAITGTANWIAIGPS